MSNRHERSSSHPASRSPRLHRRLLAVTAVALLSVTGVACGDDDDDKDVDDDVDQTEVTSASGSAVPGQVPEPVNTDPLNSQVAPTQSP